MSAFSVSSLFCIIVLMEKKIISLLMDEILLPLVVCMMLLTICISFFSNDTDGKTDEAIPLLSVSVSSFEERDFQPRIQVLFQSYTFDGNNKVVEIKQV
jgi:hypothetical protein